MYILKFRKHFYFAVVFNCLIKSALFLVMKPFAELSMVKQLLEHSNVQQFRYFKVLIQEFHVKVDLAFTNALMQLFEADEVNEVQEVSILLLNFFFFLK